MSRCFPFPPPGYENKARIEDLSLLKKEKHKKKREKKKWDHKEQRERRNRDKKDKEKYRVRDKASTFDETRLADENNGHKQQCLLQKDHRAEVYCVSTGRKEAEKSSDFNGGKFSHTSSFLLEKTRDFKIVDRDDGSWKLLDEKFSVYLPRRNDWMGRMVVNINRGFDEGKVRDENKEGDEEILDESKFSSSASIQAKIKNRVDSVEKNAYRTREEKRRKGNESNEKSEKRWKDKDRKLKGRCKDNDRDKKKRREKKIIQKIVNLERSKDSYRDESTSTDSIITSQVLRDSHKPDDGLGCMMQMKDFETNGIFHARDHVSCHSAKFTSFDLPRKNGKTSFNPWQSSAPPAPNRQMMANNLKLDDKEHELNGVIEILPAYSSVKSVQADQTAMVHSKPPHPDFKHLSQVYLVPKMEEFSDLCDQDWLYSSNASKLKKPKVHHLGMETTPYIWAEAMQIESSDICALPYVVPY